ncbi:hypothetical protein ACFSJ3_15570 [Corallincola platygyrae]|uniref:DUF2489 domain-containing protein n=1 Tax=Corallincola platygyrae TaxID=1193278 RepID=A0ABW4XPC9_9GAMM
MIWIVIAVGVAVLVLLYLYSRSEILKRELSQSRRQVKAYVGHSAAQEKMTLTIIKELQLLALAQIKRQPEKEDTAWRILIIDKLLDVCEDCLKKKLRPSELFIVHEKRGLNTIALEEWPVHVARQSDEFQQQWRADTIESFIQCCRLLATNSAVKTSTNSTQTAQV